MAYLILNDLKDMIKMLGGDADSIRDIGIAVKTLRKLVDEKFNRTSNPRPQHTYQPKREDHRSERREGSEEV